MRLVTDEALIEQVRQKLIAGGDDNGDGDDEAAPELYWRHPVTSLAQEHPPKQVVSRTGIAEGWVWTEENGNESWSKMTPEVVAEIPDGGQPKPGEFTCTLDLKTMSLSPFVEVLRDVMSDPEDDSHHHALNGNNIEMVDNPAAVHHRYDNNSNNIVMVDNPGVQRDKKIPNHHDDDDAWYYDDSNGTVHGPFTISALKLWHENGTFPSDVCVHRGRRDYVFLHKLLDDSWKECVSPTGDTYYFNVYTKETAWNKPDAGERAAVSATLHAVRGWSEHVSSSTGKKYYKNIHTGESTWKVPQLPAAPSGWSVLVDESNADNVVYQHNATGSTQWEHPHDADHDASQ
jgi:hypothetical protein